MNDPIVFLTAYGRALYHLDQSAYWIGRSRGAQSRGWLRLAQEAQNVAAAHQLAAKCIVREFGLGSLKEGARA